MTCLSKHIFAIDPGTEESGFALLDLDLRPVFFGKNKNDDVIFDWLTWLDDHDMHPSECNAVIEMVASYGMPVGKEVFETCVWIGRFIEQIRALDCTDVQRIYRKDEKMVICGSPRANDATIRQALIDRFGPVGTKKEPGWFYGVHKDAWAAIAVGVTYHDMQELSNGKRNVGGCA